MQTKFTCTYTCEEPFFVSPPEPVCSGVEDNGRTAEKDWEARGRTGLSDGPVAHPSGEGESSNRREDQILHY